MSRRDSQPPHRPLGRFTALDERLTYTDDTLRAVQSRRARACVTEICAKMDRIAPPYLREEARPSEAPESDGSGACFRKVVRILRGERVIL